MTVGGTVPGSSVSEGIGEDRNSGDMESRSVAVRNK